MPSVGEWEETKVRVLVLGGTRFVGRHVVEAALQRGHEVSLFNRGKTASDLFGARVENLVGDRDGGLSALEERNWDAVVDASGYVPRVVRDSARLLSGAVGLYVFVSTISVYRIPVAPGTDEGGPVWELADTTTEEVDPDTYGGLKVLCEHAVEEEVPGRALVVRPGLVVGPHAPTGRFGHWPRRVAEGGEVLAPGDPGQRIRFVDARDLADWVVRMAEVDATGTYNAVGPEDSLTMGHFLETCRSVSGSDAQFVWMDERFLLERGVDPWTELPLWVLEEHEGVQRLDVSKAQGAGLTFRPVDASVADVLAEERDPVGAGDVGPTLSREREAELLEAWRERA